MAGSVSHRRADFFTAPGVAYLNCAYHSPMPRVAMAAVERSLELKRTPHLIEDETHFELPAAYRAAVARLIGAREEEIAITDSATAGIMVAVAGLDWRAGDEVLIPAGAFPSNRLPWHSLAARGVAVREVAIAPGQSAADAYRAAISPRTRLLSVEWVSYATGRRYDLGSLGELAREHGALLAVDASQGIGGLPFDVRATPCDLIACAGYKWMFGPYGLGFAYVRRELIERLAIGNVNWFANIGADDFNRLASCDLELEPTARRFDRNETAAFFQLPGGTASIEYLLEVTPAAIADHVAALFDRLVAGLPPGFSASLAARRAERSNILCLTAEAGDAALDAAAARLRDAGVRVSRREGAIRLSPNIYNTEDEIDLVLGLLAAG